MSLRYKLILLLIVIITSLATIIAASYQPKHSEIIGTTNLKLAISAPLSGPNTPLGTQAVKKFKTALHNINPDNTKYRYLLTYEDSNNPTTKSENYHAAFELSFDAQPQIILKFNDDSMPAYKFYTPYENAINLLIKDLAHYQIQNIALLIQAGPESKNISSYFKEKLPPEYTLNGAVFPSDQKNFDSIINLMTNNDCDLFIIIASSANSDQLVRQLHQHGISNYQITALLTPDIAPDLNLYNNMRYIGANTYAPDFSLPSIALRTLILAYEHAYISTQAPDKNKIINYLTQKISAPAEFHIQPTIKTIKQGQILNLADKKDETHSGN